MTRVDTGDIWKSNESQNEEFCVRLQLTGVIRCQCGNGALQFLLTGTFGSICGRG